MTVTEDAPAAAVAATEPPAAAPAPQGLAAILGSGDHKVVGRLWIVAALLHLALAGAAVLAVAAEKMDLGGVDVIADDLFGPLVAYRSLAAAFLFLMPALIGLATIVVPLQVGASTLAFPRAAGAAAWTYLLGSGVMVGSLLIDGGLYGADRDGVELFIAAFVLVLAALAVGWVTIATTVISLRVPGLSLARLPLFSWANLVAATVWLIQLPVLAAVAILAFLDVRYGGDGGLFGGGPAAVYTRLSWVFGTPGVYAFAIPVLGVIGSVVPVFAQTRHQKHRIAQGLIAAFGALSVGAWTVAAYAVGDASTDWFPFLYEGPWVVVSFAILLPLLGLLGLWALTIVKGKISLGSPLLYGLVAGLVLLLGLVAGAVQAIEPLETLVDEGATPLWGTAWSSGVAALVLLSGAIALFGGLVYWAPKVLGRQLPDAPAKLLALVLLAGAVVTAVPELVAGLMGQPAGFGMGLAENVSTVEALNTVSLVGGAIVGLAVLGLVGLVAAAARSTETPGDDPWNGHTLEWATSSPPPYGNFASLPEVTSEAPLYDARHREEATA